MKTRTGRRGPGYLKIAEELREQIRVGSLRIGERLPTFAELHARYGVARATVDNAYTLLNGDGLVDRRRGSGIYVAASDIAPRTRRIGINFGLESTPFIDPYWGNLLAGVRQSAIEQNLELSLLGPNWDSSTEKNVDGAILIINSHFSYARANHSLKYPCVYLLNPVLGRSAVVADDYGGGWRAAEHLMQHGHRRIAFLSTEDTPILDARIHGYRDALGQAGFPCESQWLRYLPAGALDNGHTEGGRNGMIAWLADGWRDLGCTALIAMNDSVAIGAVQALRASGIAIPEEVSVMGFDGTEICQHVYPKLTSVRLPLEEMGRVAVKLLADIMQSPPGELRTPQIITCGAEIAPGGTVGMVQQSPLSA